MDFRRDKNLIIPKKCAKNKRAINLKITTYNTRSLVLEKRFEELESVKDQIEHH